MQITLKCKYPSGSVGFAKGRIEGLPVEARKYEIVDGLVTISGEDAVVHHDVDELLASNIYQVLTPQEQEEQTKKTQQASQTQEATDAPPAQETKKKAG